MVLVLVVNVLLVSLQQLAGGIIGFRYSCCFVTCIAAKI